MTVDGRRIRRLNGHVIKTLNILLEALGLAMTMMPEIQGETSPNFRKIIVDGVFGHVDSIGLVASIYTEQAIIDKVLETPDLSAHRAKIKRTAEAELIMSPMQMKAVYLWLDKKIKEYEALFGKIPSPEEVQTRARDYRPQ